MAWSWMQALKKATQVAKKAEPKQAKQVKSGGNPFQRAATQVRTAGTCSQTFPEPVAVLVSVA